jgi:hypothetical protein
MRTLLKLLGSRPDEDTQPIISAYMTVLRHLDLVDRDDPLTELVAKRVIELARSGIADPKVLSEQVLQDLAL